MCVCVCVFVRCIKRSLLQSSVFHQLICNVMNILFIALCCYKNDQNDDLFYVFCYYKDCLKNEENVWQVVYMQPIPARLITGNVRLIKEGYAWNFEKRAIHHFNAVDLSQ